MTDNKAWGEVNNMFSDELLKLYEAMADSRDDATLRQFQGRVQFIREFQSLVREAPRTLEKLGDASL